MSLFDRRRVMAYLVAILAAVGLASAPDANASRANMVIFGDSVTSDTPLDQVILSRSGVPNYPKCPQSDHTFAKQAARRLNLEPRDYSCTGTTVFSKGNKIWDQVDRALRDRKLDGSTKRVVVQVGWNDTYNHPSADPAQMRRDYVNVMRPQIDRIRRAAPNARIQIVGYPSITSNGHVCLFHVFPNVADRTPLGVISDWENLAQWMQIDLARATGTQFVDLKPATRNNNMCAADKDRMFAGLVDFTAGGGNMPIHINQRGHNYLAGVLARS